MLRVSARGAWFRGRHFACAIGRGGLTDDKREGDGATPRGCHRLTGLLYRADRIAAASLPDHARAIGARAIGPRDLWSDDPADPAYNRLVRAPHGFSHERLRRPDPLYDLILLTDWNMARPEPGRGSAIFVHVWRAPRHPTAGCVAFARADLLWIIARLRPRDRLIVG